MLSENDLKIYFDGVKRTGNSQYICRCPSHDDKKQSLSVRFVPGKVLIHCQAGCTFEDVIRAAHLSAADLREDARQQPKVKRRIVATYDYYDYRTGKLLCQKVRYEPKEFKWRRPTENPKDPWKYDRQGVPKTLYRAGEESETVYLVEGEKDVNNLAKLGFFVCSAMDGAGNNTNRGKWSYSYSEELKDKNVLIIPDNDRIGRNFAELEATELKNFAKEVKILDLSKAWKDMPEKADVSDLIESVGEEETKSILKQLEEDAPIFIPAENKWSAAGWSSEDSELQSVLTEMHPEKNDRYKYKKYSHIGAGNLLADIYQDIARFCPERKRWFIYNGKVWRADFNDNRIMSLCKELADALYKYAITIEDYELRQHYMDYAIRWQDINYRKKVLEDAQTVHPISMEEFDNDPYIFNCQNGTLDLRTMTFKDHDSKDMLSKISGAYYQPDAKCERWNRFIEEIMSKDKENTDPEKEKYLQKILGYSLTGDTKEECFFILYGATSRNGKGTLMETMKKLMGDYGRAVSPETLAQKDKMDGSKPNEDIARLQGARFVNSSEPDKRMILSAALIKTLTGNDTITAMFKYEHSFEFQPQFKIFINTNHLPLITDASVFSSDRVKVIPFNRHFSEGEREKTLKRTLLAKDNLSAVLNWCLEGLKMYNETEDLSVPESVEEATEEYKTDSDKLFKFIREEMEEGTDYEVKTSAAYIKYESWCKNYGFKVTSIKTFSQELRQHGIDVAGSKRPKAGGSPVSLILGYRLKVQFVEKDLQPFIQVDE